MNDRRRLRLDVRGLVQGVGFRPFVYRLAQAGRLSGWVTNTGSGVLIEAEGPLPALRLFRQRLVDELPAAARIARLHETEHEPQGEGEFRIRDSVSNGARDAWVLPDLAVCPACLGEICDPHDRRYRYPFSNCTSCGPRYTILKHLPYDRPNTSMASFRMCEDCRAEYENPADRRFHAQPIACPACGPQVEWRTADGRQLAQREAALAAAIAALGAGAIVACKGLGGFHLLVDATDEAAVRRLRKRKHRPDKPLAVMFLDRRAAEMNCDLDAVAGELFDSAAAPIVLLPRRGNSICDAVAPGHARLGAMRAYTPLHYLLLQGFGRPIVATSGNRTDEPICTDSAEAHERLGDLADYFLLHDRPIVRRADDSVVQVVAGRLQVLRRARGYAPAPLTLTHAVNSVLAVGGHQKCTTGLAVGADVILSPHIGALDNPQAAAAFVETIADLQHLHGLEPTAVVCDRHPDYRSTQYARRSGLPTIAVQHHHAHALACLAEHHLAGPALAVIWDGTGFGDDGTIWGGEFLRVDGTAYERVDHLRSFRLPGGEAAIRAPWRTALSVLYETYGDEPPVHLDCDPRAATTVLQLVKNGLHAPLTSSAGRLFDAVAAMLGICSQCSYEGQAAIALENTVNGVESAYDCSSTDWRPLIRAVVQDFMNGIAVGRIAARFHAALVTMIVQVARQAGERRVLLSGGCFQNRVLAEGAIAALQAAGFETYWPQRVPPNDGGIAFGQLAAVGRE